MNVGSTMYDSVCMGYRSECFRNDSINKLPRIRIFRAIRVGVIVGDGAVSVGSHIDKRIIGGSDGNHFSATGVGERVNNRLACHAGACNGSSSVHGHSQCRQADDVGIGPFVTVFRTVSEGVGISDRTFAAGHGSVDDRLVMVD